MRNDKSVEPLLYIGLDATPYSACSPQSKPSADVVDIVNRSRVLCLFKILYHKYIYLDINSIFDLVQVLLYESLYEKEEEKWEDDEEEEEWEGDEEEEEWEDDEEEENPNWLLLRILLYEGLYYHLEEEHEEEFHI